MEESNGQTVLLHLERRVFLSGHNLHLRVLLLAHRARDPAPGKSDGKPRCRGIKKKTEK